MPEMYAEVNYQSLALFGKLGGGMLGLLLIVWVIAVLTPKAAKLIDRLAGKPQKPPADPSPERQAEPAPVSPPISDGDKPEHTEPPQGGSEKIINSENYEVHSFFEDVPLKRQEAENGEKKM
ncbi:MAG: hypothetical protein NC395_02075 [Prevotella sp.]|nr:hypothetical protein [Prevotella sp.]